MTWKPSTEGTGTLRAAVTQQWWSMKPYTVQFVEHRSLTRLAQIPNAYKFAPKGRAKWLQLLAWKFLHWRRALDQAYEDNVTITRHLIDGDRFVERILKQKRALLDGFHKDGQRLLIGSEDYAELMGETPQIMHHHFEFRAEIGMGRSGRASGMLWLTVEVIPWMRGAVVMP